MEVNCGKGRRRRGKRRRKKRRRKKRRRRKRCRWKDEEEENITQPHTFSLVAVFC